MFALRRKKYYNKLSVYYFGAAKAAPIHKRKYMNPILEKISSSLSLVKTIGISDVFDILIIAFLIYKLLGIIIRTNMI